MAQDSIALSQKGRGGGGVAAKFWWQGMRAQEIAGKVIVMLILLTGVVIIMIPFYWMIAVSLMNNIEIYASPPVWIPERLVFQNYVEAVTTIPFFRLFRNTIGLALGRVIGTMLSASLVAFGFARLRAKDRDVLFLIVLGTMMLPGSVTLIPQFLIFYKLGWYPGFKPLIIPAYFGGGAYNIFLLRQFFMTIPLDYDDAARIDGCGYFQLWWRIMLPLSAPALATVAIFNIMWSWNDFMGPLIYLKSMQHSTLALGIYLFMGVYDPMWNQLMAMSVLITMPLLITFFFAQRMFIQGVVITGIKG